MKILALGIGNVVCADEGVGVHLCRTIEKNYKFTSKEHTLTFVDGGTLAERLIPIIVEYDYMIVFDCVSADGGEIGDVYFFDFDNVPNSINWSGSAHEVEMLQTLVMMDMVGDRPTTKIVGIIPEVISETTLNMSRPVIKGAVLMEQTFIKHLKELGFECKKINNLDIQAVAQSACERDE